MVARGADGVYRTQPFTSVDVAQPLATADGQTWEDGWNDWVRGHLDNFRDEMIQICAYALGHARRELHDRIDEQAEKIKALELELVQTRGALDVLRGKGAPGAFRVRGTYDGGENYAALDVVALNGSSFVALKDRPGECPGDGWQLLASAGRRGERGTRGEPGAPGKDGRFPPARVWGDQVYYAGDVVVYEGSTYQAVNDTGKPPIFAKDWTLLAVAGRDGQSLRPRGSFDADVEYRALDVVLCNGSSYVALSDAPGECPSNKWQLLAAAATDGKDGATGPRGERGERGLIGPRAEPAPRITGWRVDHAAYTAVPLLSDGSEGAPLELRGLFKQFLDEVAPRAR